jgi:parallel beta-helix repeat protein
MRPSAQGNSFMWDIVKTIHEALHVEQTWMFVTAIALIFAAFGGGSAWLVDKAYKNSAQYKQEHAKTGASPECPPDVGICAINGSNENDISGNKDYRNGSIGIVLNNSQKNRVRDNSLLPESSAPQTDPLLEEFKYKLKIHAGNTDQIRRDCTWFRDELKKRWEPYSASERDAMNRSLNDVLSVIIGKAKDKQAVIGLSDNLVGIRPTP